MTDGPWHRRHWVGVDVAAAICFMLIDTGATLAGSSWWPARPGTLAWVMLGLQAAACLSLVFRRRAPLAVVAILAAFTLAVTLLVWPAAALTPAHAGNVWAPYATTLAAYGVFFSRQNRWTLGIVMAIFTVIVVRAWQPSVMVITVGLLRIAVGPLLALYFGARRRLVQALTERAERAERERHLLAEQARAEERALLAGEMHDVVTHRVTLMVLQAGALRLTAADEVTRQAAEQLRAAGCQALDELRDLVGILRTAPEGDVMPSTPDFAALVAESTSAGTPAELVENGDPAATSPVVRRTAFRIVREALTNVHKHAPGARVTVRIAYGAPGLRLTIRNSPPASPPNRALADTGSGLGIASLRHRIELLRGTLRAEPTPDGGFCVEATLPAYVPTSETAV
jgi:signal transduction histidine kinase